MAPPQRKAERISLRKNLAFSGNYDLRLGFLPLVHYEYPGKQIWRRFFLDEYYHVLEGGVEDALFNSERRPCYKYVCYFFAQHDTACGAEIKAHRHACGKAPYAQVHNGPRNEPKRHANISHDDQFIVSC